MRASFESGVFSVVSTQPIWIIKTRLQLNLDRKQTGIKKVKTLMTEIYAQHGIKGFYRGMSLSLVLSSHGVFQLTIYEKLMNLWEKNVLSKLKKLNFLIFFVFFRFFILQLVL